MERWFLVSLHGEERDGYVAGSGRPPEDPAHSGLLDLRFTRQSAAWQDASVHYHRESEEYYAVLAGSLVLEVGGETVTVPPGHLLGVRAGTAHRVVGGRGPVENVLVRVPGGRRDCIIVPEAQPRPGEGWFLLDLHAPAPDYLAGGCLAPDQPGYSPHWDFWCGWGESLLTWRGQEHHYHRRAEEYYLVLQGRLDLEVDGQIIPLEAGHILGVKAGAVHGIVGGREPIDTLFIRVPGGRGDKVVVGTRRFLMG